MFALGDESMTRLDSTRLRFPWLESAWLGLGSVGSFPREGGGGEEGESGRPERRAVRHAGTRNTPAALAVSCLLCFCLILCPVLPLLLDIARGGREGGRGCLQSCERFLFVASGRQDLRGEKG